MISGRRLLAAVCATWGVTAPAIEAAASPCLRIGIAEGGSYHEETVQLVTTIVTKAGLCAEIVSAPQNRLNVMEKEGTLDGDAWRDEPYLAANPALLKVPTPVQHFSVSIYWRKPRRDPTREVGAEIGILLGRPWAREALKNRPIALFEASSYHQLLQLARTGRLRGFVMPTLTFRKFAVEENEPADAYDSREILRQPLYLAVQNRLAGTVPALDEAIKALWADGTISDRPTDGRRSYSPASR